MIDYLDKPPQRYDHGPSKERGNYRYYMVEAPDGEWVKFKDMDLYMFEGAQGIQLLICRVNTAAALLRRWEDFARDYFNSGISPDLNRDTERFLTALNPQAEQK